MKAKDPKYALSQHEEEYERLGRQAERDNGLTERLFRAAGIAPGMRILDVGCGAGHVSALASLLVGPQGSVVGIDREKDVLDYAQSRVAGVTFVHGDFRDGDSVAGPFDAVVGRYVLMYQSDPTDAVTALATKVRSGGVLAFHEMDIPAKYPPAGQWPESQLAAELGAVILKVWRASGTQLRMGARLPSIYAEAGLDPDLNLLTEALVSVGREGAALTVGLLRSMEPLIRDLGLADLDQLDLDTAVERLVADAQPPGPINIGPVKVGAWARKKT